MRIVQTFPHRGEEVENLWIPLGDGTRLAARLWLPADARRRPVPAVVEYLPYRKRDGTRWRDEPIHRYLAGHGYAALRIDLRGTGDSDGVLADEYTEQELADGEEALAWIAAQDWCDGGVGMMGISWGGINALQVAARRPPALKAVISVCSTDDRYADDAHFMGGCLLNENLIWGAILFTYAGQPPDPDIVGERWRRIWLERLEALPLYPEIWLRHQRRDAYWRHGSVAEDYARIGVPVLAVGGWADGYTNAVPRLLAGLKVPRKGLVGPWAHVYPHEGVPGPAIGFLQETLRWWDHWLRGRDTGIMDEPMYRVWMQDSVRPRSFYAHRPGRWVAEEMWPSPRMEELRLDLLGGGRLQVAAGGGSSGSVSSGGDGPDGAQERRLTVSSPLGVGGAAGSWCGFGIEGELPGDQREDDAGSLVFETEPLAEPLEILGEARARLALAADLPQAMLAVRLNDVAPDGSVARVSYGLLNLTHRRGHERPEALIPGREEEVEVSLNDAAHSFAPGHRIRLALSTGYWPMAWPSPARARLTLRTGASSLLLPVRPPREADAALPPFPPPESAAPPQSEDLQPEGVQRTVEVSPETGEITSITAYDLAADGEPALARLTALGLELGHSIVETFTLHPDDPLSPRGEVVQQVRKGRGIWRIAIDTRVALSCDDATFHLEAEITAREGERTLFSRSWRQDIPRNGI